MADTGVNAAPRTIGKSPIAGEGPSSRRAPTLTPGRRAWRRFRANWLALAAALTLLLLVAIAFAAPLIARHITGVGPADQSLLHNFEPASRAHWLGTDEYGRDVVIRLVYGGRVSLGVAALATAVMVVIGTLAGALAAFYGGWVDQGLMWFVDVMLSIPALWLMLLVAAVIEIGPVEMAILLASLTWYQLARLVRSEVLTLRRREFVEAARVLGAPGWSIMFRHILPNVAHIVIVSATVAVPSVLLAEAGLSYLGLGIQPPTPSWGNMLDGSTQYLYKSPGLIFYPGLAITVTVLAVSIVGNALRDALDPRLQGS